MNYSTEAIKNNIFPSKAMSEMTEQDWFEFRNSIDPDIMGFDGIEGYPVEDFEADPEPSHSSINTDLCIIKDNLTSINYTDGNLSRIKYIVIHYTGNNGDTSWGNTNYFKSTYRGASAHYFVDENATIWRCVKDEDIAWHCGGGLQGSNGHSFYKICTNSNSIGIEMCSRKYANGEYYFKEQTIVNCVWLVTLLMKKYNIPITNIIRHYDVTGKICPAPFVKNESAWDDFKLRLTNDNVENKPGIYKVVKCDKLNVRTGNSTSYDIIGTLKSNTEVEVVEFKQNWGKIKYNEKEAWVSLNYLQYVYESKDKVHWAQEFLDKLSSKGYVTDVNQWNDFESPLRKDLAVALVDKVSGGLWDSNYADSNIHWAQPHVISLYGKKIITDINQWVDSLENNISKALILALVDKMTNGTLAPYTNRYDIDHWGRNCLDSLCDKAIVTSPNEWIDFESEVKKGNAIALICKAIKE